MHVTTGKQTSPFGTNFIGVTIRIGEVTDPSLIQRTYDDIQHILHGEVGEWKERETRDSEGHFQSLIIEA